MADFQRPPSRTRSNVWSRAAGHLVVIGLVALAAAGGLVSARGQAAQVAGTSPGLSPQSFPFSLVALAQAAEASEAPITRLNLQLEPEDYVEPIAQQQDATNLADTLLGDQGAVVEDAAPEVSIGTESVVEPPPVPQTVPVAPAPPVAAPLAWPVAGGSISQYFYAGHLGIDIAAPWGTAVVASGDGVVTYAGWRENGGGYVIEVTQNDGFVASYNHLGGVWVFPGQAVGRGEAIGAIGCTGICTGPHLHFAVFVGGSAVNPLRYM